MVLSNRSSYRLRKVGERREKVPRRGGLPARIPPSFSLGALPCLFSHTRQGFLPDSTCQ